jgi:DNA polymerase III delta' subunit
MTPILWKHCAGQQRVKEVLEGAIANGTLGHAYLFSGQAGSGKFAAALDLATALLCESKGERPCMACASCHKVNHYAHPDFHVIMPVVLAKEHRGSDGELSAAGWDYISACVKERIGTPYTLPDYAKVPSIPVDWMREINHTILRGTFERGANIVIIDGIDTLNKESANSMLKLLEEPPQGTLMLLLTDRINAVLPTLVSRCQILRFSYLSPQEIIAELCARLSIEASDPRLDAVVHTGSLGRSLYLWNHPPTEATHEAVVFWNLCVAENWAELGPHIDRIGEWNDFALYEHLFMEIIERVRNTFLSELAGTENLFLGAGSRGLDGATIRGGTQDEAEKILGLCQNAIGAIKAHGNITLVLANFAMALSEAINGEKQQAG